MSEWLRGTKLKTYGDYIPSDQKGISYLWANNDFPVKMPETPEIIQNLMIDVLTEISTPPNFNQLLMRSLYQWGLNYLEDIS